MLTTSNQIVVSPASFVASSNLVVTGENTMKTTTYTAILGAVALIAVCRKFIVDGCYENADGWLPCIKARVYACLVLPNGDVFFGANWMTVGGIEMCPRVVANTTSYELCASVCGQGTEFHAERQAIWAAYYSATCPEDVSLVDGEMFITGHTWCCDTCKPAMFEEGIAYAGSLDSGTHYERGESAMVEFNRL